MGSVITWNNALIPNVFYRLKVWEALNTDSGERKQAYGLEVKEIMATLNMIFFVLIGHILPDFKVLEVILKFVLFWLTLPRTLSIRRHVVISYSKKV